MTAPLIAVDPQTEIAPYQQIEEQIRAAIQRGDLAPGALLPTVRQLAGDLNVAPNTVARAYANLAAEGWILSDGRRGTKIAEQLPSADKRVRSNLLKDALERAVGSLLARGYGSSEILAQVREIISSS
ncbi:MAG TPA: GntR family transcriptional regulator [Candidatus Baltobacteraceae bacterium]|nr:GntR family transcriptional regulator [Candidatus Baltobacteraceae bacterium]